MLAALHIHHEHIVDFCHRWGIVELALFGSVLSDSFGPDSDIDVLVTFAPDARWDLFDLVSMADELESIFGRHVDLVEAGAIRNPFRRQSIFDSKRVIHAA
ncbi:MAG: nucleotidyltransferase family protein [Actinobacteria bacterium]|nr:nucleotidyltransferase family protein [Actinomycetota bacterium]